MRRHVTALEQFKQTLGIAEELLSIERKHHNNPPRLAEQKAVQGLRGGVAVLSVAAFESFLKELMEEQLGELVTHHHSLSFEKLPDALRVNSVYKALDRAMKGPPFQTAPPKDQRIPDIERACLNVISRTVDPRVFCEVSSNPNSKNVKALFRDVAIPDIFTQIKSRFDHRWGKPTAQTFIEDKLNEVVNRRHIVAHTADALQITRSDLKESLRFLKILAGLLELELKNHTKNLIKTCC